MSVDYVLIGSRIREVRMQMQISQNQLAESADLSVSYISCIETGKKKASLESLIRIANVLRVTVDELLNGNQMYNPTEYQTDMDLLLAVCGQQEKRLVFELVNALTDILLKNGWTLQKKK